MTAVDAVSQNQFDVNADLGESPERPTMNGVTDHMNPHQFHGVIPGLPDVNDVEARHPHRVSGVTVHQYMNSLDGGFGKVDN